MRRITPTILLAALVGCSSSSKSLEPAEPARAVGTSSPSADTTEAGAAEAPTDAERIAAMMASFEKMVVAFEPADGDCGAMAERVLAFSETEDAEAIRRMARDEELNAFMKAHRAEIERDYAPLMERFLKTVRTCERDDELERALDRSKLFLKKREDGTVIEEDEGEG